MGDMSSNDLLMYCLIIGCQFLTIILLCCAFRSKYLNHLSLERIERELERQDRKHDEQAIKYGFKDPVAEALEERDH